MSEILVALVIGAFLLLGCVPAGLLAIVVGHVAVAVALAGIVFVLVRLTGARR